MNHKLTLFFLLIFIHPVLSQNGLIKFIENKGQFPEEVNFYSDIPGGRIFFLDDGITYTFYDSRELAARHEVYHRSSAGRTESMPAMDNIRMHAVQMKFGAKATFNSIEGIGELEEVVSYFYGNDPSKWATECTVFESIQYNSIFQGIDLVFYSEKNQLKYDLILHNGANARDIEFLYQGQERISAHQGNIYVKTSLNEITENKPYAYSIDKKGNKKSLECNYKLTGNRLSFDLPKNPSGEEKIVIDPLLIFSTYSGSTADNWGFTAAFDQDGNLYSGGIVFGTGFPATFGQFNGGAIDVGVLKYDSTGSSLIFAAYIGGSGSESPHSLIVNDNNELIILGTTGSTNFPVSADAYQPTFGGGQLFQENGLTYSNGSDIFITKLNRRGTEIEGSTYIGGSANDGIGRFGSPLVNNYGDQYRGDINVDTDKDIYVASNSSSVDFPIQGGFQTTFGGGTNDAVVFKLNAALTELEWSTFLGGIGFDAAYSVKFDSTETVYIAGGTTSSDYPTTVGSIQETQPGNVDGFVAKISQDGQTLLKSTYMGTDRYNQIYFLDLDTADNVYVLGQTQGPYPFDADVYHVPNSGQFIQKISNDLDSIYLSTTFGSGTGSPEISPTAFLVNECGNIYVSGWGSPQQNFSPPSGTTADLPVTEDAIQKTTDGSDFYLMVLERDFRSLLHATFFGGRGPVSEHVDGGTSRFDKRGIVYHAVCADCGNQGGSAFPSTPGAYSETNNAGNCNNAAFKFDLSSLLARLETNTPQFDRPGIQIGCRPFEVAFINRTVGGIEYFWNFGNGQASSSKVLDTVLVTYPDPGEYDVTLIAIDQNTCKAIDRATTKIFVFEGDFNLSDDVTLCQGDQTQLTASGGNSYVWRNNGIIIGTTASINVVPDETTYYSINAFDGNGCEFRDSIMVTVIPDVNLSFDYDVSPGCDFTMGIRLINNSIGSEEYIWDFGNGVTSTEFAPEISLADTGNIQVTLRVPEDNEGCTPPLIRTIQSSELFIPNIFTPNVDGINETFQIISNYNVDIKIFNRWGRPVFSAKNYQNDWTAGEVGSGVYYYELTFKDGGDVCNGWVQVLK